MKKKVLSIVLAIVMLLSVLPLSAGAEERTSDEKTPAELMESYARVVVYAEENGIPLGMSLDVYESYYNDSDYQTIEEYENATIEALANQDSISIENSMDKSPLDYSKVVLEDENEKDEDCVSEEETDLCEDTNSQNNSSDQVATIGLQESFHNIQEYINEKGVDYTITFEQFQLLFNKFNLTLDEFEQLMCLAVDEQVSPNSLAGGYYNDTGTSLPSEATYTKYNLVSALKKGDILYEPAGVVELAGGHAGIVVGRFFDTSSGRFYIRCIEAIFQGVRYGIIDDGRIDRASVEMYRVNATSAQKDAAIEFCKAQYGANWSIVGWEKKTENSGHWYCSELVWAGYKRQGIDLDAGTQEHGVRALEILSSPYVSQITISSSQRPSNRMTDISSHWGKTAIQYVADNGIVDPVGSRFLPNNNASRATCVVGMYRMADGEPYYSYEPFTDVSNTASYRDAVAWAYNENISSGTGNNEFSPNSSITREDFAVILYKFAQLRGCNTSYSSTALNSFTDRGSISSYATTAMKWAVSKDIMNGRTSTTLVPKGTVTRAELASMLNKFINNLM